MKWHAYPSYEESGAEWLGEIPSGWAKARLKYFASTIPGGTPDTDNPSYWSEDGEGIPWVSIGDMSCRDEVWATTKSLSDAGHGSKGLHVGMPGTILFAMYASVGEVSVLRIPAVWNQALLGFEVDERLCSERFLFYGLQTIRDRLPSLYRSNTQNNLNADQVENLPFALPGLPEQYSITDFLDREIAKIDALIVKQEDLIATLREDRTATITHAVTKGLNPHVEVKESGFQWVPDIPDHWSVTRLGRLCRAVSDGPHFSPSYVDDGVMFLSARNIKVDGWSLADAKFISEEDFKEFSRRVVPEVGDVLYTKGGTTGIARAVDLSQRFQVWVHLAVLKLRRNLVEPDYLAYALNSSGCYEQSQLYTRGATNQDLGLTRMVRILLALPPLDEQREIVEFLNTRCGKIDVPIAKSNEVIEILREYRSALITDAVTGKIDVRAAT